MKFALIAIVWMACGRDAKHEEAPPAPAPQAPQASPAVQTARADVRKLTDEGDAIAKALDELNAVVDKLATAVDAATTEADRTTAKAQLATARTSINELSARSAALHTRADELVHTRRHITADPATAGLSDDDNRALDDAIKSAQDVRDRADKYVHDATDVTTKLVATGDKLDVKQNDADRAAARAKLEQLQAEQKAAKAHN